MTDQGWFTDPTTRHELRYWNGSEWTEHVSDRGTASTDPLAPAPPEAAAVETPAVETPPAQAPSDWAAFRSGLADVLAKLADEQYLVLSIKGRPGFVQFAGGSNEVRGEVISNAFLDADHKLDDRHLATCRDLGWEPPSGEAFPNWYRTWAPPVPFATVAEVAVETLQKVLDIEAPSELQYKAFTDGGDALEFDTLGIGAEPEQSEEGVFMPANPEELRAAVLNTMRRVTDNAELDYDADGDLGYRVGSTVVFVRPDREKSFVRVFSPLLGDVETTDEQLRHLNDLNTRVIGVRLMKVDTTVVGVMDVMAAPYVPDHLVSACVEVGGVADEIDEEMQKVFGGRTFFGDPAPPKTIPPAGGYL